MKPEKWLVISAGGLSLSVYSNRVMIHIDEPPDEIGLVPGTGLAIDLTEAQARELASALSRKADEASG